MNGAVFLIMLTLGLGLAAAGAVLYLDNARSLAQNPIIQQDPAQPRIISVQGHNISNSSAHHVRIQVTSDEPVRLNQTTIHLTTGGESASLEYRNGTLERNATEGFYTQ